VRERSGELVSRAGDGPERRCLLFVAHGDVCGSDGIYIGPLGVTLVRTPRISALRDELGQVRRPDPHSAGADSQSGEFAPINPGPDGLLIDLEPLRNLSNC
jgi:hypothetical protein